MKKLLPGFLRRRSGGTTVLRRFKITPRLVLCFSITSLLMVALGAFCLFQMQEIRNQGEIVESGSLPSIAMADALAITLVKMRSESIRLIANADDPGAVVTSKINVETFKGTVQLSGFVRSRADINKAVEVAKGVKGVKSVKNDMIVKGQQ